MQGDSNSQSLGAWVRKQRVLWQQANLSQDRMQILSALGFDVGAEAEITEEWEYRFDQLAECLIQMVSTCDSRSPLPSIALSKVSLAHYFTNIYC